MENNGDTAIDSAIDNRVEQMMMVSKRRPAFVYADEEADDDQVLVPYTRAQYLALPRKLKKSVLMNVKKLLRYNATKQLLQTLYEMNSTNPRILDRIHALEERLKAESEFMPKSQLWKNAVQRLKE